MRLRGTSACCRPPFAPGRGASPYRRIPACAGARCLSDARCLPARPQHGCGSCHLVDLAQPDHVTGRGQRPARLDSPQWTPVLGVPARTTLPGLPPARGVIALREVVEMAGPLLHPPWLHWPTPPAISETSPSGE